MPRLIGVTSGNGLRGAIDTRQVSTISGAQLEIRPSRVYLGDHWGFNKDQGRQLDSSVTDAVSAAPSSGRAHVCLLTRHAEARAKFDNIQEISQ